MRGIRLAPALVVALSLLPSPARAEDPFADFRIPEHHWFSSLVSGQGNISWARSNAVPYQTSRSSGQGNAAAAFDWHAESEAVQRAAGLHFLSHWNPSRSKQQFEGGNIGITRDHDESDLHRAELVWTERHFVADSDLGAELAASLSYTYDRATVSRYFRTYGGGNPDVRYSFQTDAGTYLGRGQVSIGVGQGRVRDVTGVYLARVLEHRLQETGRLERPISAAALRRLAELFYAEPGMSAAHERADRYFWREVERVLREDGALEGGTLDAWSLERSLEPVTNAGTFSRARGARVSLVAVGQLDRGHADEERRDEGVTVVGNVVTPISSFVTSSRGQLDRGTFYAGVHGEYERPAGLRWQSGWASEVFYGDGPRQAVSWAASASLLGVVADRWYSELTLRHDAVSRREGDHRIEPDWFVGASTTLGYRVEDSWYVDVQAFTQQGQTRFAAATLGLGPSFDRATGVVLGLRYRPAGRFELPGLGISEHLTPARL